ncbi:hypothetical protein SUGI_0092410 [Cryptomeria japonica]|nr:hypothetical protein SUGI_0092410 [Cryptomeria japonica]
MEKEGGQSLAVAMFPEVLGVFSCTQSEAKVVSVHDVGFDKASEGSIDSLALAKIERSQRDNNMKYHDKWEDEEFLNEFNKAFVNDALVEDKLALDWEASEDRSWFVSSHALLKPSPDREQDERTEVYKAPCIDAVGGILAPIQPWSRLVFINTKSPVNCVAGLEGTEQKKYSGLEEHAHCSGVFKENEPARIRSDEDCALHPYFPSHSEEKVHQFVTANGDGAKEALLWMCTVLQATVASILNSLHPCGSASDHGTPMMGDIPTMMREMIEDALFFLGTHANHGDIENTTNVMMVRIQVDARLFLEQRRNYRSVADVVVVALNPLNLEGIRMTPVVVSFCKGYVEFEIWCQVEGKVLLNFSKNVRLILAVEAERNNVGSRVLQECVARMCDCGMDPPCMLVTSEVNSVENMQQRMDQRDSFIFHRISLKFDRKNGAAEVKPGQTHVVSLMTGQLLRPYRDRPDEGTLSVYTKFFPMIDPTFEVGHPGEFADLISVEKIGGARVTDIKNAMQRDALTVALEEEEPLCEVLPVSPHSKQISLVRLLAYYPLWLEQDEVNLNLLNTCFLNAALKVAEHVLKTLAIRWQVSKFAGSHNIFWNDRCSFGVGEREREKERWLEPQGLLNTAKKRGCGPQSLIIGKRI